MMVVTPWDGRVTRASFKFLEEKTGKTWQCECVFDENGMFVSASAVEVK
jgi:hypothetical protein